RPAAMRSRVLLPQPLGPSRLTISPGARLRSMSSSTRWPAKALRMPHSSSNAPISTLPADEAVAPVQSACLEGLEQAIAELAEHGQQQDGGDHQVRPRG